MAQRALRPIGALGRTETWRLTLGPDHRRGAERRRPLHLHGESRRPKPRASNRVQAVAETRKPRPLISEGSTLVAGTANFGAGACAWAGRGNLLTFCSHTRHHPTTSPGIPGTKWSPWDQNKMGLVVSVSIEQHGQRHPFKVEIMGSKPIGGTTLRHKLRPLAS